MFMHVPVWVCACNSFHWYKSLYCRATQDKTCALSINTYRLLPTQTYTKLSVLSICQFVSPKTTEKDLKHAG